MACDCKQCRIVQAAFGCQQMPFDDEDVLDAGTDQLAIVLGTALAAFDEDAVMTTFSIIAKARATLRQRKEQFDGIAGHA